MKYQVLLISCILCLAICLGSCSTAETEFVAMTAYFDDGSVEGVRQSIESDYMFDIMDTSRLPDPEKESISVNILGARYDAAYVGKEAVGYGVARFEYKTAQGDMLKLDSQGNIVQFKKAEYSSMFLQDVAANEALSPENSLQKAREYLVRIFGETIAARFEAPLPDTSGNTVWFHFKPTNRDKGAYTTSERIALVLNEKGELLAFYAYHVGAFDGKELPPDFTDAKIKDIINASLTERCDNIELSDTRKLVVLEGRRMACVMSFRIMNDDGTERGHASVVIPLE